MAVRGKDSAVVVTQKKVPVSKTNIVRLIRFIIALLIKSEC